MIHYPMDSCCKDQFDKVLDEKNKNRIQRGQQNPTFRFYLLLVVVEMSGDVTSRPECKALI